MTGSCGGSNRSDNNDDDDNDDSQPGSDTDLGDSHENDAGTQKGDWLEISSISTQDYRGRAFCTYMENVTNSNTVDEVKPPLSGPTSRKFPSKLPFISSKRNIEQSTQGRLPTIKDTSSSSSSSSDTDEDDNDGHSNQTARLTRKQKRFPSSKRHIRLSNTTLKQHTEESACLAKQGKLSAGGRLLSNRPAALNPCGYDAQNCYNNDSSDELSNCSSEDHSRYVKSNKQPTSAVRPYRLRNQKRKRNHSTADEDGEYEVEKILNARINRVKLQYCVKWLRYDDDPEW
jgi:hypothetical protein